jgi:hypothetical protein
MTGESETIATERIRKPIYVALFFPGFYTRVFSGETYIPGWHYLYDLNILPVKVSMVVTAILFWLMLTADAVAVYQYSHEDRDERHKGKEARKEAEQRKWWVIMPLLLLATMALTLRLYKGDKPDYYLYSFLPVGFVLLGEALTLVRKKWLVGVIVGVIFGHEIYALAQLPPVHADNDFRGAAKLIDALPKYERTIVPLSQNLVAPLTFFYENEELSEKLDPEKKFNVLVCERWQNCTKYRPNTSGQNNYFKYDLVNWRDYSVYLPDYKPTATGTMEYVSESVMVKVVEQKL